MAKKSSKKSSVKKAKPALAAAVPAAYFLEKEELEALNVRMEDLKYLKRKHTEQLAEMKVANAEAVLAEAKAEIKKIEANDALEAVQRTENAFNGVVARKQFLIADICEKRGLAVQELSYNPTTGEITNIP